MSDDKKSPVETFGLTDDGAYLKAFGPGGHAFISKGRPYTWVDQKGLIWKRVDGVTLYYRPREYEGVRVPEMKNMILNESQVVANFGVGNLVRPPGGESITGTSEVINQVMAGTGGPSVPEIGETRAPQQPFPAQQPAVSTEGLCLAAGIIAAAIFAGRFLKK